MKFYHYQTYNTPYSESNMTYRNESGAYIFETRYPLLYAEEAQREINNVYSSDGLLPSQSRQAKFHRLTAGAEETYATASSIKPVRTNYNLTKQQLIDAIGDTYTNFLYENGRNNWIATRCIDLDDKYAYYGIKCISNGNLQYATMWYSGNGMSCSQLFPIVEISAGTVSKENNVYVYTPIQ